MGNFGTIVMVLFVVARVLIVAGLIYLAVIEVRKTKGRRAKSAKRDREDNIHANGKDIDRTPGNRI